MKLSTHKANQATVKRTFDIIVIGGGHAGAEAAWAASRLGASVALITLDPTRIGQMSCNPAIGGLAKGQMVREIDALGGLMAIATDNTGIQFRMLNRSKGPAVWGPRAQADKYKYALEVQRLLATCPILHLVAGEVADIVTENVSVNDPKRSSDPDAGSELLRRAGSNTEESGSSEYLRTGVGVVNLRISGNLRRHRLAPEIQKLRRTKDILHAFAHGVRKRQAAIGPGLERPIHNAV
jgi:hypothetical protein